MASKLKFWFVDRIASNLRLPQKGPFGWMTTKFLIKRNSYLETNAVDLCNIQPDHNVLEIGFGPGIGLKAAHEKIKGGKGRVYGIDLSYEMVTKATNRLAQAVETKKVVLFHGSAEDIPVNTDSVHCVFHCNCYYFWPDKEKIINEIYRVMRPGGVMVTTINMSGIKHIQERGLLKYGSPDPVSYMSCLEKCGFDNVHMKYLKDANKGLEFQAIFANINAKPAHNED